MSWHDLLPSRLRAIFFGRENEDDDMEIRERGYLAYVVIAVLKFPFQVILFPLQAFKIFQNSEVDLDEDLEGLEGLGFAGRLTYRAKQFFGGVYRLVVGIALAPFRLIGNLWMASFSDVVFVIPVFLMFGLSAFVFSQVIFNSETIKNRYLMGVQNAMSQGDFQRAKTYFGRLLGGGDLAPRELFQWAIVLAQTGEGTRADALIAQLAPEDRSGFGGAHRLRALSILSTITAAEDPNVLKRLHWHLTNSNDRSPETSRAWAAYYLALGMHEEGVKRLKETAELDLNNYLLIARIYKDRGQVQSMRFALKDAEAAFAKILERDQLNQVTRIKLARVYTQLEEYDNAEQCLLRGMRIQPDPDTKAALSDFYVLRHDLAREFDNEDVEKLLGFLIQAIDLNPNHAPIYERLMIMCHDPGITPEKLTAIRKSCQQVLGGDTPTPLAHFALSNVLWAEGNREQAKFHVEQAYQMDNKMVVVLNNLAWYIAHDEVPDLPRALELIELAVSQNPDEIRLRSTYGTVLMKLGRDQEAARELELSLTGVMNRKEVHRKLAILYENLGSSEMASIHRENSLKDDD